MKQTIFITGGAGYVGEMLCDQFSKRDDVERIITLDKEPQSDFSKSIPKLTYIHQNMADDGWQDTVRQYNPTVVIHTAWQIRAMYGAAHEEWRWNVDGSDKVFVFACETPSVEKLIHFSTASSYSARASNTLEHRFTELEGFRDDDYIYALEKKEAETRLANLITTRKAAGEAVPQVFVVRPAAITGPRGRYMRIRFGLQSALQGNLKGSFVYRIITSLTAFVPATKGWVRQFIHEDDVTDIVTKFSFEPFSQDYVVFNITPEGDPVLAADMAKAVGKRILPIYPWMARIAFFFFWHATRGKVPTCPGSWRFYSYPLLMSGSKLATVYECKYSSKEAFAYTDGRYESFVPELLRRSRKK
jgi:nucleoside-diphosphate-sugar epimerase